MRAALPGVVCAVLAACLSPVEQDEDDVTPGWCPELDPLEDGICSFPCDADCVTPLPTHDAALAAAEQIRAGDETRASARIVPPPDRRYGRAAEALAQLWPAVESLFPDHVRGLGPPWIVLVAGDERHQASVLNDRGRVLWFVQLDVTVIDAREPELTAVLAHELVHLVFKHGAVPLRSQRYYRAAPGTEPIGFHQANDEDVRASVERWLDLERLGGSPNLTELDGLPAGGRYARLLASVLQAFGSDEATCAPAWSALEMLATLFEESYSELAGNWVPTGEQLRSAEQLARRARDQAIACVGPVQMSLTDVLQTLEREGAPRLPDPTDREGDAFDSAGNLVDGIRAMTRETYREMDELWTTEDLASARFYDVEEEADDVSLRILHAVGLDDSVAVRPLIDRLAPGDRPRCESMLDSGTPPPYGSLAISHRAGCFRAFHARQVGSWLMRQGTAP